jgi:hypothetical protein
MADGAAGLVQRVTENGQENDRRDNTLKREKVLNLSGVSRVHELVGSWLQGHTLVYGMHRKGS